jgi:hypothetical protein
MIRKPVVPRLIAFTFIYIAAFVLIVFFQFSRKGAFTRTVGNFVVSGHLAQSAEGAGNEGINLNDSAPDIAQPGGWQVFELQDGANISFGGLEFRLFDGEKAGALALIYPSGERQGAAVTTMQLSQDAAQFELTGGAQLTFHSHSSPESSGILISLELPAGAASLEIPYRLLGQARRALPDSEGGESGDGGENRFTVLADGEFYGFDRSLVNEQRRVLSFSREVPTVFYRVIPKKPQFNPALYMVSGSVEKSQFNDRLSKWRDSLASIWEQKIAENAATELEIAAYVAEASRTSTYNAAVSVIPSAFRDSAARTYIAAPFLGRTEQGLRTLSDYERRETARVDAALTADPALYLAGSGFFGWLTLRSQDNYLAEQETYIRTLEPKALTLTQCLGVFEKRNEWAANYQEGANPFELLVERALELIAAGLRKSAGDGAVLVFDDGRADIAYNLRLGRLLAVFGEQTEGAGWAGVGRSLVLSVLTLTAQDGSAPGAVSISMDEPTEDAAFPAGDAVPFTEDAQTPRLAASDIYGILDDTLFFPHAQKLSDTIDGLWAWSVSPQVTADLRGAILDVAVRFPVASPHYLFIRGVTPFSRIQLREIDYRSDPQFERYNSPGWVYSPADQTLLVKLVHRTEVEHVLIFY